MLSIKKVNGNVEILVKKKLQIRQRKIKAKGNGQGKRQSWGDDKIIIRGKIRVKVKEKVILK